MTRHARDFRNTSEKVDVGEILSPNVWYRSPLWDNDHLIAEDREMFNEGLSWCGRALTYAQNWENEELGGLWISNRKSGNCGPCKSRQDEWDHAQKAL